MKSSATRCDCLTGRISEILFYVWDPFKINLNPACRNEYDIYVPIVAAYLVHKAELVRLRNLLIYCGGSEEENDESFLKKMEGTLDETVRMLVEWRDLFSEHAPNEFDAYSNVAINNSFEMQIKWSVADSKRLFAA